MPTNGVKDDDSIKLEPALRPHFAAFKASPNPTNATKLMNAIKPTLDAGVRMYGGKVPSPMTHSRAKRIALDAFHTYEPDKGTLKTHITSHLQGLQRYAAKQTQLLHVPDRVVMDQQHLDASEQSLRDELGRDPSSAELADRTGMSIKRQAYVRKYKPGFAEGQATQGIGDGGEDGGYDPAVQRSDPLKERLEFLYPDLDPINQLLVEHTFGLHGRPVLKATQLARRLNISNGAVSQRAQRIQSLIDELEDARIL